MEIILAAPSEYLKNALLWGVPIAHMSYKTCGSALYRTVLPDALRRGYMLLANTEPQKMANREKVCEAILTECRKRAYRGVICDFSPPCSFAPRLIPMLCNELRRAKLTFFASEWAGQFVKGANVIISTAISGGTLLRRLTDAIEHYGSDRIMIDAEISSHVFSLPSPDGSGHKLQRDKITDLIDRSGAKSFYSEDLCCYYFNYRDSRGVRMVLYDNTESIRRKMTLASRLGINKTILLYPELDIGTLEGIIDGEFGI